MKEFLRNLGITQQGNVDNDGNYVIDLESDKEFNKVFSILDKSEELDENDEMSVANIEVSNIMYESDDFTINLIADFAQNIYKLVIQEN